MSSALAFARKAVVLVLFFPALVLSEHLRLSFLEQARRLKPPSPTGTLGAEFEHSDFWRTHNYILKKAWNEIGLLHTELGKFNAVSFVSPPLHRSVQRLKRDPSKANERRLQSLWKQVVPGVWSIENFIKEPVIKMLREELRRARTSGIPSRRPNGMNRFGVIVDIEVDGAVPLLHEFVTGAVNDYVRPLGRTFFPSKIGPGDDQSMFAFTIRYSKDEDQKLNEHRDASVVTLNLNLNVRETNSTTNSFTGSSLYFVDKDDPSKRYNVSMKPGMALIHTGELRHAALPLQSGERENLIVWLFGKDGYVRTSPYRKEEQLTVAQRWSIQGKKDSVFWEKKKKGLFPSLVLKFLPQERGKMVEAVKAFERTQRRKLKLLFVCEGNTCRSAFAEYLTHATLSDNVVVSSLGIDKERAPMKLPMNSNAQIFACGSPNCDGNRHASGLITKERLDEADRIVFMNRKIWNGAQRLLNLSSSDTCHERFVLLSDYSDDPTVQKNGINDPWFKDNKWWCGEDGKHCRFAPVSEQVGEYRSTMLIIKRAIYNLITAPHM